MSHLLSFGLSAVVGALLLASCSRPSTEAPAPAAGASAESPAPKPRLAGKSIEWIVPSKPGGGYDVYSRMIAPYLAKRLESQVTIRNVEGASGAIAADVIKRARPDGQTIGFIITPGLLAMSLAGNTKVANPLTDFTILGRAAGSQQVWIVGRESKYQTLEEVLAGSRTTPVIFGVDDVNGSIFPSIVVSSDLAGLDYRVVPGFTGTPNQQLALVRGDVDLISMSYESALPKIENGELRPILQVAARPIADHPSLQGVPLLGGDAGIAATAAERRSRPVAAAVAQARALAALNDGGRLIVAPAGLDPELAAYLEEQLYAALTDPQLQQEAAVAHRSLEPARGREAAAELKVLAEQTNVFVPLIRQAMEALRQ